MIGESMIKVHDLIDRDIKYLAIKHVYANKHEIYDPIRGIFVPIKYNALVKSEHDIYKVPRDLLHNKRDLFLSENTTIKHGDETLLVVDIYGSEMVELNNPITYAIVTQASCLCDVDGMTIHTWAASTWMKHVLEDEIVWADNIDLS